MDIDGEYVMEEAVVTQKQPQDLKAERSIIGAILMRPDDIMKATDIISSEDFYSREYAVMFETLVKMYNEKQKKVKLCLAAAGIKRKAPTAYKANPNRIPLL